MTSRLDNATTCIKSVDNLKQTCCQQVVATCGVFGCVSAERIRLSTGKVVADWSILVFLSNGVATEPAMKIQYNSLLKSLRHTVFYTIQTEINLSHMFPRFALPIIVRHWHDVSTSKVYSSLSCCLQYSHLSLFYDDFLHVSTSFYCRKNKVLYFPCFMRKKLWN